jgi:hypothetical protein
MAIVDLNGDAALASPPIGVAASPTLSGVSAVINAADEGVGFIFRAPKTGLIRKIGYKTATVTTGATLDIRVETVSTAGSPASPSGTLWATNTSATQVVGNGDDNTYFLTTLTADASVTKGDLLAVVIKQPTASSGDMQITYFTDDLQSACYIMINTGVSPAVSWALVTGQGPVCSIEYSDGTYAPVPGMFGGTITASNAISTSTTPDVIGLRFQVPYICRVSGAWAWIDADGDFTIKLVNSAYHQANATGILATTPTIANQVRRNTNPDLYYLHFTTAVEIAANTNYRLVLEPTTSTSATLYTVQFQSAAQMGMYVGGSTWHYTTAKDPTADGSWTNYNSGTFERPYMAPLIDGIDVSSGGGMIMSRMLTGI